MNLLTYFLVAILGPSGAGKTTLLDVLSGRANRGRLHSESKILVNGQIRDNQTFRNIAGYVMQDDSLLESLTVRESLLYSALLRLPSSMTYEEKEQRVNCSW